MRRIRLSLAAFFCTAACTAACSSGPAPAPTSGVSPQPTSKAASSGTAPGDALSLTGDGHALYVHGTPADPSYVATYPVTGLTAMTVTASSFGDLSASCASGGGAVACKSLPFFAEVGASGAKIFDAYGHVVMAVPLAPAAPATDAGGSVPSPVLPSPPSWGWDGGAGGGIGIGIGLDAGGCAPSVTASLSGCSLTVAGTTCDCSDATCTAGAIEACLSSVGVPIGIGGGGGGLFPDDAGIPGIGALDDAGPFSAACDAAAITSAKAQFCSDVDAWLTTNGVSATLDCAAIGTLTFPTTLPAPSTTGFTCDQITHDAFVKVRTELATCDPLEYVGWDSSAELQLFEDSACTVW